MNNARFWTWVNDGQAKITLKPDQCLRWWQSTMTDEGWSFQSKAWTHAGDRVTMFVSTDGQDCDGRLSTYRSFECRMDMLRGWECDGEWTPDWQQTSSRQRDYQAEAAGY